MIRTMLIVLACVAAAACDAGTSASRDQEAPTGRDRVLVDDGVFRADAGEFTGVFVSEQREDVVAALEAAMPRVGQVGWEGRTTIPEQQVAQLFWEDARVSRGVYFWIDSEGETTAAMAAAVVDVLDEEFRRAGVIEVRAEVPTAVDVRQFSESVS